MTLLLERDGAEFRVYGIDRFEMSKNTFILHLDTSDTIHGIYWHASGTWTVENVKDPPVKLKTDGQWTGFSIET